MPSVRPVRTIDPERRGVAPGHAGEQQRPDGRGAEVVVDVDERDLRSPMLVDPLAPRPEVVGAALVGDRSVRVL